MSKSVSVIAIGWLHILEMKVNISLINFRKHIFNNGLLNFSKPT